MKQELLEQMSGLTQETYERVRSSFDPGSPLHKLYKERRNEFDLLGFTCMALQQIDMVIGECHDLDVLPVQAHQQSKFAEDLRIFLKATYPEIRPGLEDTQTVSSNEI